MSKPAGPIARGVIHDLGYKRYAGPRLAQATRWRVIMRNQISSAWKTWWRYKAWIGVSVLVTFVIAAVMYASKASVISEFTRHGMVARQIDQLALGSIEYFRKVAFLVTLTCGAGIVASDRRSGAFTFYFSRPVRPIDYLFGKLAGLTLLHFLIAGVPMIVLMLVRLGLSADSDELLTNLELLPRVILIGLLAATVYASMSLMFSSLFSRQATTIGVWAGYYVVVLFILFLIGVLNDLPWLATVDFGFALQAFALDMFGFAIAGPAAGDVSFPTANQCLISLCVTIAAAISITYLRIRSMAHAGIGGS